VSKRELENSCVVCVCVCVCACRACACVCVCVWRAQFASGFCSSHPGLLVARGELGCQAGLGMAQNGDIDTTHRCVWSEKCSPGGGRGFEINGILR
jgi:hypothetical protein